MKKKFTIENLARVLAVVYLILSFINIFLPDGLSARTYPHQTLYTDIGNRLFAILRWFNEMSLVVLPIAIFYKKKTFSRIAMYILPIVYVLCVCCFGKYLEMYTNGLGEGIMNIRFFSHFTRVFFVSIKFRIFYLDILFLLEGLLIAYIFKTNYKEFKFTNKKEIKKFLLVSLGIFLIVMPIYAPSYVFGGYFLGSEEVANCWWTTFERGSFWHILWILSIPVEIIVLYKILSKFNKEDRYIAIVCLSLALFYQFSGIYTCFGEIITKRYPFQLCNLGCLTLLPIVIKKNKLLSRFALFINMPAAIFAVILCDSSAAGVTYIMNVHYIVEHSQIITVPLLAYMLGVFEPADKKTIKEIIISFSIYYVFVFIVGGIFTGLLYKTGCDYWDCNYLFMFNAETTAEIVGFTKYLFEIHYRLFDFFDISLIHPFIYFGFIAYILIFYVIFNRIDKLIKTRKSKKQLKYNI